MSTIKNFHFSDENYEDIVLSTTIEDPYFLIEEIYNKFSQNQYGDFFVLVDLFLRNGYSYNRYWLIRFDSKGNYSTKIVNPREVSDNIKKVIKLYLIDHIELLYESALSKETIDFVKTRDNVQF